MSVLGLPRVEAISIYRGQKHTMMHQVSACLFSGSCPKLLWGDWGAAGFLPSSGAMEGVDQSKGLDVDVEPRATVALTTLYQAFGMT